MVASKSHKRAAIGLTVRYKGSGRLKMPGYDVLNDLMNKIDPQAYAAALNKWLQANIGIHPRSLSLYSKSIGDGTCGMIITLCRHEGGRPAAVDLHQCLSRNADELTRDAALALVAKP